VINLTDFLAPFGFEPATTTVWDFPERGNWATHKPDYRGNFAPQVARNLIIHYSEEGETVLDPMVGSGTTLIEARLLNRNAIGLDINQNAVDISAARIAFEVDNTSRQTVAVGDIRRMPQIEDESMDLVIVHPPYLNLVNYSDGKNPDDLSNITTIPGYLSELRFGIQEIYRVLRANRHCALLMGDTRKGQHYVPLSMMVLQVCLQEGFVLKEQLIKTQHNTTFERRWRPMAKRFGFYLIMHEHLYVFRKPKAGESLSRLLYSTWAGINTANEKPTEEKTGKR
jgi:DNA modification methylase